VVGQDRKDSVLSFINLGTCMLKFTELRWQVGRWLYKGGEARFSKLEYPLCNQEMKYKDEKK